MFSSKQIFACNDFFVSYLQNIILSLVRILEVLSLAGTQAPDLASVTRCCSTATQAIVYRGQKRLCAWEAAATCGAPRSQGVWVRAELFFLSFFFECVFHSLRVWQ